MTAKGNGLISPFNARRAVRMAMVWLASVGLLAMVLATQGIEGRLRRADCPAPHAEAKKALEGHDLSSLALELAGTHERVFRLLHPVADDQKKTEPGLNERVCAEARINFLSDELTELDTRWFMPVYGLLSMLVAAWLLLPLPKGKWRFLPSAGIIATTLFLLVLDAMENVAASSLLVEAERSLFIPARHAVLDMAANAARDASLVKWFVASLWAVTVALALWTWPLPEDGRLMRLIRWAAGALFMGAALALGAAVAWSVWTGAFGGPVKLLGTSMTLALLAMLCTTIVVWQTPKTVLDMDVEKPALDPEAEDAPAWLAIDAGTEFHLEEYRQLRTEVTGLLARIELLFRSAIIVAATAFAWLVSQSLGVQGRNGEVCLKLPRALLDFAWLIPPVFVLCAALMAFVTNLRVNELGGYLRRLEQALGHQALGWEFYLSKQMTVLTPMTQALWLILFGLSAAASWIGWLTSHQAIKACN